MSEYSYHYSQDQEQEVNFLEHSAIIRFETHKLDSPFTPHKNQPTHYTDVHKEQLKSVRTISFVDVRQQRQNAYLQAKRGRGDETMQLHPNFKTITRNRIKELIYLKLLNEKQYMNFLTFLQSSPSFRSFRALFLPFEDTQQLQYRLIEFYSSSKPVYMILSSRISIRQKLKMFKFIEKLRQALLDSKLNRKWKQI